MNENTNITLPIHTPIKTYTTQVGSLAVERQVRFVLIALEQVVSKLF